MTTFAKESLRAESRVYKFIKMPGAKLCIFTSLTILIFHSVMSELYFAWRHNHYYYHGFLIPLISFYLVYRNRNKLKKCKNDPYLYGFMVASLGISVFLIDRIFIGELFLSSLSMLIFLAGMVLLAFGKQYLRVLLFPIIFLVFMIPIPDFVFNPLIVPLQLIASKLGEIILGFLGIPVHRVGIYLHLAPFTIEVDKSCSSMHSLIALSSLSCLVAYLMVDTMKKRIVVVASSIPLAILANGFRLVLIIVLALWQGPVIFRSFFHPLSGKLSFLAALSVLVFGAEFLNRTNKPLKTIISSIKLSRAERK
jgi:exosortase